MKTANIAEENHWNELRNFNQIFRKDVTYVNIKSQKKKKKK